MDVWPRCLQRLEAELLYAPNAFVMEEVRSHYLPRIRELAAHFGDAEVSLDIGAMRRAEPAVPATGTGVRAAVASEPFQGNVDPHYTFDNFVEGRSNQLGCCCTEAPASARPT